MRVALRREYPAALVATKLIDQLRDARHFAVASSFSYAALSISPS